MCRGSSRSRKDDQGEQNMIYTLTLNPSLDHIIYLDTLKTGEINRSENDHLYAGGKGINVSFLLHELGSETCALGFTAGDTGALITRMTEKAGITQKFIPTKGYNRINVKISADSETEINGQGLCPDAEDVAELLRQLETLQEDDILVISGSMPKVLDDEIYDWITALLYMKNIRFVCDYPASAMKRSLFRGPFLIKPNRKELEELYEKKISDEEIPACAAELQQRTEGHVLISLGADGAVYADPQGHVYTCKAAQGRVMNSVGSGDAMVAGFLHGYETGLRGRDLLLFASACGSACAFSERFASAEDIQKLYEKIKHGG